MPSRIPYRPDIDGLRAVAVALAISFHLRAPGFHGGFVGVDIFLTISGFLIFSILIEERQLTGAVRWAPFFARRVLRLFPEALAMIAVILVIGRFVLAPSDYEGTAKSAVAASVWAANFYFWRFGGDYFGPDPARQPFLHLWSLGIEEQFYLTVPAIFAVATYLSRLLTASWLRTLVVLLAGGAGLSICLAVWASVTYPVAGYYLLPPRSYEFAIGALVALWLRASPSAAIKYGPHFVALGGVGLFSAAATAGNHHNYPGCWALLPTTSTGLLLAAGTQRLTNPFTRFLEFAPVAKLGKISYGWYLWHFPLLILWREYRLFDTSFWDEAVVVLLALLPAYLGQTVVAILRHRDSRLTTLAFAPLVLRYGLLASTLWATTSASLILQRKWIDSEAPDTIALRAQLTDRYRPATQCFDSPPEPTLPLPECVFGARDGATTVVLWGDSHANHWVPALEQQFQASGIRGIERAYGACPPGLQASTTKTNDRLFAECRRRGTAVLREILELHRRTKVGVILSARWAGYVNKSSISRMGRTYMPADWVPIEAALRESIDSVTATLTTAGIPVAFLLQVPEQRYSVPLCVHRRPLKECEIAADEEALFQRPANQLIQQIARRHGAMVLDLTGSLCASGRCIIRSGDVLLYHDDHHLSVAGARSLSPLVTNLVSILEQTIEQANDGKH